MARRSSTSGLADGQHCDDFRSINVKLSEYLKPLLVWLALFRVRRRFIVDERLAAMDAEREGGEWS